MSVNLLGRNIPLYGLFFWLGIFVAAAIAVLVCKKKRLPLFDLTCSAIYTIIGAMIGAKLLYLIVSFKDIVAFAKESNLELFEILSMIIKGGFVFYGGLLGGILGLFIYAKQFKMDLWNLLDIYAVVVPIGHAFGRIGCFFGGCCYGIKYSGPLAHVYEIPTGAAPVGVPLLPIQLIEAFCLFLLFMAQIILLLRYSSKNHILVFNYAITYSVIRFVLEFFRGDAERGSLLLLSTSQWLSIGICGVMIFMIVNEYKQKIRRDKSDEATIITNEA